MGLMCELILEKIVPQDKNVDFPAGAVVKNPPANARVTGSIPSQGRSHMPLSNEPVRHNY